MLIMERQPYHLRKSSIVTGEHGSITRDIGSLVISKKMITFTPGHVAFLKMR
jgi:translation initiation factor IF-2